MEPEPIFIRPDDEILLRDGDDDAPGMYVLYVLVAGLVLSVPIAFLILQSLFADSDFSEKDILNATLESEGGRVTAISGDRSTCACCNEKKNDTKIGGCGHYTCDQCFKTYVPLPDRCAECLAFYCYRRLRGIVD